MTDEPALLRAILADPADDTVRLAYADWLDENDQPERAEFIRVQVELARMTGWVAGDGWRHTNPPVGLEPPGYKKLRKREGELFTADHAREWGLGDGWRHTVHQHTMDPEYGASQPAALFSRGFVSHLTCTAATFLGGPLYTYDPASGEERTTGRTEGIAAEVFARHPVTAVALSDREPYHADNKWSWVKWVPGQPEELRPDDPLESAAIKKRLWDHIEGHTNPGGTVLKWFPTRDAALAALSAACVRLGRSLAGLPALPPGQPNPAP